MKAGVAAARCQDPAPPSGCSATSTELAFPRLASPALACARQQDGGRGRKGPALFPLRMSSRRYTQQSHPQPFGQNLACCHTQGQVHLGSGASILGSPDADHSTVKEGMEGPGAPAGTAAVALHLKQHGTSVLSSVESGPRKWWSP